MMDGFSTLVLLALLTLGNATPLTTVTQALRTDEEVFREAVTDGFIVDQQLLTSMTTQAPQDQTTTQKITTTEGGEEGSAMGQNPGEPITNTILVSTTQATSGLFTSTPALPAQSSTLMATLESTLSKSEDQTTMEPSKDKESITTADLLSTMSESGSGEEESTTNTPYEPEGSGRSEDLFSINRQLNMDADLMEQDIGSGPQPLEKVTEKPNGHVTPEWIIIVGFLVGLAVIVVLCVAIATREKWNGPGQFNQTGVTLSLPKQNEVEMEEFLQKKHPKENFKAEEYTVIPLDELPDSYSS